MNNNRDKIEHRRNSSTMSPHAKPFIPKIQSNVPPSSPQQIELSNILKSQNSWAVKALCKKINETKFVKKAPDYMEKYNPYITQNCTVKNNGVLIFKFPTIRKENKLIVELLSTIHISTLMVYDTSVKKTDIHLQVEPYEISWALQIGIFNYYCKDSKLVVNNTINFDAVISYIFIILSHSKMEVNTGTYLFKKISLRMIGSS